MLQTMTGKLITFIAILDFAIDELHAPLFKESALLPPGTAAGAIRHTDSLTFHIIP
jgi:hypothetical protein